MHWEELVKNMIRPLILCDLDFTDLHSDDDKDDLMPRGLGGSVPPPPPPIGIPPPMKPMQTNLEPSTNFRHMNGSKLANAAAAATANVSAITLSSSSVQNNAPIIKKNKKTVNPI